jgi:hypothetical protein
MTGRKRHNCRFRNCSEQAVRGGLAENNQSGLERPPTLRFSSFHTVQIHFLSLKIKDLYKFAVQALWHGSCFVNNASIL